MLRTPQGEVLHGFAPVGEIVMAYHLAEPPPPRSARRCSCSCGCSAFLRRDRPARDAYCSPCHLHGALRDQTEAA